MKRGLTMMMAIVMALLAGCGPAAGTTAPTTVPPQGTTAPSQSATTPTLPPQLDSIDDNYRVFYQVFVGSFSDSNGDGTGDLRGLINRLDYLNDGDINSGKSLGIQGIWLSPIFSSPSYHKYDARDYRQIDKSFGSMEDLQELIDECHKRNVKVILDLVLNHTSRQHPWFEQFVEAHKTGDTESPYYDYYTYCTAEEQVRGRIYAQIPGSPGHYYERNFSSEMPELNFDNPVVRQECLDIAKFYLDMGIDGFRFDAVKYIYYGDTQQSSDFWVWYMDELRAMKPDIYCVGECWSGDDETLAYTRGVDCFNFQMSQAEGVIASAARGNGLSTFTKYVPSYQKRLLETNPNAMMMNFIANHDMDRAAGFLPVSMGYMKMAANLYILCGGSPFIYYGEEIGLKGARGGANTDANRRLAMLWGDEDTVKDPVGATYDISKQTNGTVADQLEDENSLYHYYRQLIAVRNRHPEIGRGVYETLSVDEADVGGFRITYDGSVLGLLHNTAEEAISIQLEKTGFTQLCDFIGQGSAALEGEILTIGPRTSVILK